MDVRVSKTVDCKICGNSEVIWIPPERYELPVENYTCTNCFTDELNALDNIDESRDRQEHPYVH